MGDFEFDAETQLTAGPAEGTFEVEINDRWAGLASVNGGFLMATCLKALATRLPFPDPLTVSGSSCALATRGGRRYGRR